MTIRPFRVPKRFGESPRESARMMSQLFEGKLNNIGEVTLTANAASTTVIDTRTSEQSVIVFMPSSANAAAEVGAGGFYVSSRTAGTGFVIAHANNAQTDRTFSYAIFG